MNNKLTVKDLINVGVFTALYLVLFSITSFIGFIPIFMLALPIIIPLVVGIPFMLFLSKVNTFGMVSIMRFLYGLFSFLMGHPYPSFFIPLIMGIITDLLLKSKNYKSMKMSIIASGTFNLSMVGMYIALFFGFREPYFESLRLGYGDAYADTLYKITPNWAFYVLTLLCFIGGVLGGLIGKAVLKKHFKKAGIV